MKTSAIPALSFGSSLSRLLLPVAGAFLLGVAANAAPVIDINFSGDTLGAYPTTNAAPGAGNPLVKPTTISKNDAYTLFTVRENYQSGDAVLTGRSVVMQMGKFPAYVNGSFNVFSPAANFEAGQDYAVKMDLLFSDSFGNKNVTGLALNLFNSTHNSTGHQAQVVFVNGILRVYSFVGTTWTSTDFVDAYDYDDVFNLELRLAYSTQQLEVYIDNTRLGSVTLAGAKGPQGFGGLQFAAGAPDTSFFEVGVANIQGYAIPEPGMIGMIGAGGALLLAVRRYRRGTPQG